MNLPKQVMEQLEVAEEKVGQLEAKPQDEASESGVEEQEDAALVEDRNTDVEDVPIEDPIEEPEPEESEQVEEEMTSAEPISDGDSGLKKEVDRLTQANIVLRTKYDAEVPRLAEERRELREEIKSLREELRGGPEPEKKPEYLEKFSEDWDEDTIKMVDSLTDIKIQKMRDEIKSEYESKIQEQSRDTLFDRISARIPKFEEINGDPKFVDWLTQEDDFGRKVDDALQRALDKGDVDMIVNIFNKFQGAEAPKGEVVTPSSTSRQVVPKKTHGAHSAPKKPKVYSGSEYAKLMENITLDRLPKDKKELLEKELNMAIAQGRVKN